MCSNFFCVFFFKVSLCIYIAIVPQIWDYISKTVFPKLFFCSLLKVKKMSRNMCKLRVKLGNATIYPPWGPIFKKYYFKKRIPPSSKMLDFLRRWHLKDIDEKNHGLFNQGPYNSHFCVKWVGVLLFQENGLAINFTWQNETSYVINNFQVIQTAVFYKKIRHPVKI